MSMDKELDALDKLLEQMEIKGKLENNDLSDLVDDYGSEEQDN